VSRRACGVHGRQASRLSWQTGFQPVVRSDLRQPGTAVCPDRPGGLSSNSRVPNRFRFGYS